MGAPVNLEAHNYYAPLPLNNNRVELRGSLTNQKVAKHQNPPGLDVPTERRQYKITATKEDTTLHE